jgi:hypothetical protein
MKQQNKWEKIFDEWLDLTEFTLIKHQNDYNEETDEYGHWSLVDNQGGNIGNIEGDRFTSAMQIPERMDIYVEDYIVNSLEKIANTEGIDISGWENYGWDDLLSYRDEFPEDCQWDFDVLDMMCYHFDEINLENCFYEEEC